MRLNCFAIEPGNNSYEILSVLRQVNKSILYDVSLAGGALYLVPGAGRATTLH